MDRFKTLLRHVLLITITVITLFPFVWMFRTSVASGGSQFTSSLVPENVTWENYKTVWLMTDFPRYMMNSLTVASISTILSIIVASLAGYALSRFVFKGKAFYSQFILFVQMFPAILLVIPLFMLIRSYGLLDSYLSLVIAYVSFSMPFCTWMLKGFFDGIPRELEEAAMVDGCNRLSAFCRVIIPVSAPGIGATAMYSFLLSWNEYLYALVFMQSSKNYTLPVGLGTFIKQTSIDWGLLMSGATLGVIPVLLLFVFLVRYLVTGLTAGAVKG